ncbi:hypothetical protein ACHAQJ_008498 [Trichoderma viride]
MPRRAVHALVTSNPYEQSAAISIVFAAISMLFPGSPNFSTVVTAEADNRGGEAVLGGDCELQMESNGPSYRLPGKRSVERTLLKGPVLRERQDLPEACARCDKAGTLVRAKIEAELTSWFSLMIGRAVALTGRERMIGAG